MFVFDNSEDLDIATYEYRLYTEDQVESNPLYPGYFRLIGGASIDSNTVTPYSKGYNTANVFTVAVENSTTTSTEEVTAAVSYYGAIRPVDTSTNLGPWTLITRTSTDTPLIDEQFIGSLTAAKITAGEIGAAEITLAGANSIIKSSTYNFDAESTTSGWFIRGDGHFSLGGPNGITYDNETIVIGDNVQVEANFAADSISVPTGGVSKLNINSGIGGGVGGMTVGDPTYNYWYANGNFSVGGSGKYFKWDGTNITTTGTIIGTPTITGGSITGSSLDVGSGTSSFHVDATGRIWSGNSAFGSAPFSVTAQGALTATGATIIGNITATSGSFTGTITSTSGTIGGWNINSSGLSKTVSGSSSYIYPSQIVLGILNEEVSGNTVLSAARMTMSDDNYFSRVKTDGISIEEYAAGTTSYFKHFGAQLYGSMNLIGGTLSASAVSASTVSSHTMNIGGIAFPARINDGVIIPLSGQGPWRTNLQWTNGGGGRLYYQINDDSNVKGYLTKTHLSDRRLKNNISQEVEDWLNKFNQIKIYEFEYNNIVPQAGGCECIPDGVKKIGVIADEIEQVFPQYVLGTAKEETLIQSLEGKTQEEKEQLIEKFDTPETTVKADGIYSKAEYQQVDYSSFVPLLMAVNLNQNKLIEQLSAKVDELESRLI